MIQTARFAKLAKSHSPRLNGTTRQKEGLITPRPLKRRSVYSRALGKLLLTRSSRTYMSIDPAPPTSGLLKGKPSLKDLSHGSIETLRVTLTNPALPLFERYRAMFALRNIGTDEAVDALASGFSDDSALFKFVSHHFYKVLLLIGGPSDTKSLSCSVNSSPRTLFRLW